MSNPANSDTTLLTEHFTYRPAALIDDIVNSINILSFKATNAVEKGLLSASPSDLGFPPSPPDPSNPNPPQDPPSLPEEIKHEIENGVHQLETLLEAKIDKNFDRLEIYAFRNILNVPAEVRDWVRLRHYEGLRFEREEGEPDTESVKVLRGRVRETGKLRAVLLGERKRNEGTLKALRKLILGEGGEKEEDGTKKEEGVEEDVVMGEEGTNYPVFKFLGDKGGLKGDGKMPVSTTTEFALSQLPALRSLLTDVEGRLRGLKEGGEGGEVIGEEEKDFRRQRLEFVEKETRRHLESVRGLELGEMGEVRDGEWQGDGRKLGRGEVEDLEKVVGMVGGGEEGEPMDQS